MGTLRVNRVLKTPLPDRVRPTHSLYLLTIGTQAAPQRHPQVPSRNPNPQVDQRLFVGARNSHQYAPTSPQYRFVPQTPNKDEPFIIVMSGVKQHTRAATMKHDMNQTTRAQQPCPRPRPQIRMRPPQLRHQAPSNTHEPQPGNTI